jgi:hypothetical protein
MKTLTHFALNAKFRWPKKFQTAAHPAPIAVAMNALIFGCPGSKWKNNVPITLLIASPMYATM